MEVILDLPKYHYIIGVAVYAATAGIKAGKLYMKYFLSYTEDEVEEFELAKVMTENKMWKTTYDDALKGTKCSELLSNLYGMRLAAHVNQANLHHFVSETELDGDFFDTFVSAANNNQRERELLEEAKI